jgi:drug/metabolite transporter (DMT)-like permease
LQKSDLPWLAGASLAGGVIAPILLLFGLRAAPAASASLLLNFEGVATTLIAAAIFGEAVGRRAWLAILLMTAASILLSFDPHGGWGMTLGSLGVLGACVFWGLDNNFTRNISAKDPLSIVMIKGLAAGTFSLGLAFLTGSTLPALPVILGAMLLGSLSYGLSITLFIRAMRGLGAARTSALFATAPLAGITLSFLLFRDMPGLLFLLSLPLVAAGTVLMLNEDHGHVHRHAALQHEHWHRHDDGHHSHAHPSVMAADKAHSHPHQHTEEEHTHPHLPDLHHRHRHSA